MTTLSQESSQAPAPQRQPANDAFSRPSPDDGNRPPINVAHQERLASVLGGSLITLFGLRRRSNFGAILALIGGGLIYRGVTGHCPMYEAMGKNTADGEPAADGHQFFENGVHVEQSLVIDQPADELYRFWRNFENLPRFMDHLESVKVIDDRRSHWVAKAPAGTSVEWYAEVINDVPGKLIAWRSLGGADVDNAGSVRFLEAQDGHGTEVRVTLDYIPPAGELGRLAAKLFGEEPSQQVADDLHRFKAAVEQGQAAAAAS